jgi:hypothetical protein
VQQWAVHTGVSLIGFGFAMTQSAMMGGPRSAGYGAAAIMGFTLGVTLLGVGYFGESVADAEQAVAVTLGVFVAAFNSGFAPAGMGDMQFAGSYSGLAASDPGAAAIGLAAWAEYRYGFATDFAWARSLSEACYGGAGFDGGSLGSWAPLGAATPPEAGRLLCLFVPLFLTIGLRARWEALRGRGRAGN